MIIWDVTRLAKLYTTPFKKIASKLIFLCGCQLPLDVKIGQNVLFAHNAVGTVIHRKTVIMDNAYIFQGVTIGKADIFEDYKHSKVNGFIIGEGSALCAGAKILCKEGTLEIGRKAIVAANAVLTHSIGPYEIWGGHRLDS
jgi:serine O-acetyltransferase